MRTFTFLAALTGAALIANGGAPFRAAAQPAAAPAPQAAGVEPNTTGPIDRPLMTVISPDVYMINEFGADTIELVVGTRRALVIDTGSGFFDLKAKIATLTSLPYDVVITHGHPDHAGGAAQFDSVYIDPADMQMVRGITYEGRVRYGHIMRTMTSEQMGMWSGFPNVWGYTDANVMKWDKQPVMKPLHDGMVFDLGGRRVTAYHTPNHTPGSTVFIDDKSRIIFTGDAANINIGAVGTVSDALRSVLKIKALRPKYDRIYTGHIAYANWIEPLPEDLDTIDDIIENFRSILRGNPTLKVIPNHLNPERSMTVAVHGKAKSAFDPKRLWGPNEAHVIP